MNFKKLLALTLATTIKLGKLGAFTDVKHIDPACATLHTTGTIEIVLSGIPNMKESKFTVLVAPDGRTVTVEGHSEKETDYTREHTKRGKKYRTVFAKMIILDQMVNPKALQFEKYKYKHRKDAALKGVIFEEYVSKKTVNGVFSELRIKVPTVA